jgi:hypothetical protein
MNPTVAAWVRQHAWTDAVRAEAKSPATVLGPRCQCQRPFTSALCAGGGCKDCDATPFWTAETALIGLDGWIPDRPAPGEEQGGRVWLWLADRTCVHRCDCACHGRTRTPLAPFAPFHTVHPGVCTRCGTPFAPGHRDTHGDPEVQR